MPEPQAKAPARNLDGPAHAESKIHIEHRELYRLIPGVYLGSDRTCGLERGSPACQLARANFRPGIESQPFACAFAPGNLACGTARRAFSEKHPGTKTQKQKATSALATLQKIYDLARTISADTLEQESFQLATRIEKLCLSAKHELRAITGERN